MKLNTEWLNWSFDWQSVLNVFVKTFLALFCGGIIGIERGKKKRPTGFRTYMLKSNHTELIEQISALEGVIYAEEI